MTADAASHIDLVNTPDFVLGGTTVRPSSAEILNGEETIALEPRVMQVLVHLARRRGETVTRDDLIATCWRGVVVGEDAIQRCIGRLRKVATSMGGFEIETLSRIGYRLREQSGGGARNGLGEASAHDERPVVALLNIQIFATAPDVKIFAHLLARDVSAALSLNRDLQIVAGSVAALQAEDATDLRRMGDEFGVDYVAEGTLRRVNEGYRVAVQLLSVPSGRILWSHRVDIADIESPTDDLVIDIAGRLSMEVMRHESDRALRKPADLTAWEAVVRANTAYQRISLESLPFAIAESRRAVELDPEYAAAHAALANGLAATYEVGGARDPALAAEAQLHCDRALTLDSGDPSVLTWLQTRSA